MIGLQILHCHMESCKILTVENYDKFFMNLFNLLAYILVLNFYMQIFAVFAANSYEWFFFMYAR